MIEDFQKWVSEGKDRDAEIKISKDEIRIWVWDGELTCGQFVKSVEEIDLEKRFEEKLVETLKRMQERKERRVEK